MSAGDTGTVTIATATADDFSLCLNDTFRLQAGDGELTLTLVEVRPLGTALRPGGAFALLFVAAEGPSLRQAVYALKHASLGRLDIFLVPIGPVAGGAGYEAVFT
jgi:hypothetical protein